MSGWGGWGRTGDGRGLSGWGSEIGGMFPMYVVTCLMFYSVCKERDDICASYGRWKVCKERDDICASYGRWKGVIHGQFSTDLNQVRYPKEAIQP